MRFVVVDVETANARMHSICQIGIVAFENGVEVVAEATLVDPREYFDGCNIAVHGITEDDVRGSPTLPDLHGWLGQHLSGQVAVCHTHFDRVALKQACDWHAVAHHPCQWLDSARVARRAWPRFSRTGYGLANLAENFGIIFQHHDALEDARAAGQILLRAMHESGLGLEDWLRRVEQPLPPHPDQPTGPEVVSLGEFYGERVVFTGRLQMVRARAADLARCAGMEVEATVNKGTTLLVVGDQDLGRLAGKEKSSKHIKAEEMINRGSPLRILSESDFIALVAEVSAAT